MEEPVGRDSVTCLMNAKMWREGEDCKENHIGLSSVESGDLHIRLVERGIGILRTPAVIQVSYTE